MFLTFNVTAIEFSDIEEEHRKQFGFDEHTLPDEAAKTLSGIDDTNVSVENGFEKLLDAAKRHVSDVLNGGKRTAGMVLIILVLFGAADNLFGDEHGVGNAVSLAGTLAISAAVLGDMNGSIGSGRETIETLNVFSKGLLISLAGATGVIGAPAAASSQYVLVMAASELCITVINKFITPLLYTYIAAVIADSATGTEMLSGVATFIKRTCTFVLTAFLTVFTALLSLSGIISGSADAVTMKTTKLLISNAVPVVGSILSDATESVVAAARIVRNSAGLMGIFAVAAVCIGPFIKLGLQSIFFRLAGVISQAIAPKSLSQLTLKLADAFSMLLGMVAACSLINLVSIISFMRLTGAY